MSIGLQTPEQPMGEQDQAWQRPLTETAFRVAERFSVATPRYNLECLAGHGWWSPEPAAFDGATCKATEERTAAGQPVARASCDLPLHLTADAAGP